MPKTNEVSKEEKKYTLIVFPNEELKKLDLKNFGWQWLHHLDSMEDEADFGRVCEELKDFTNLKEN